MADDLDFFGSAGFGGGGLSGDSLGADYGGNDSGGIGDLFGGGSGGGFGVGGIFKAASSLFGGFSDSSAYKEQAQSYRQAAAIARENARIEQNVVEIKQFQEQRKVNSTLGQIRAGQAANGFGQGGSGISLLADSSRQGALMGGSIGIQGAMEENAFLAQAAKAEGEAKAAEAAASKSSMGGILGAVGSIAGMLL